MPLTLLVNPVSAGGRSLALLPRVEAVLDARRVEFRVERTRSLDHGVDLALRAVELGEVPVVVSGDGLMGAVGGALAGAETPVGLIPGGRGNALARALGIPDDPEEALAVGLADVDPATVAGEDDLDRRFGVVGDAERPGEVVAAPAGDQADGRLRARQGAANRTH